MTTNKATSIEFFKSGHAIFTHGGLEWVESFMDMSNDYGIIPYPKLSTAQSNYGTTLSDVYTTFLLPIGVQDRSFVGMVMEVLASTSYVTTTSTYYELLLKVRGTRDSESREIMDKIHDSIQYRSMGKRSRFCSRVSV